MSLIKDHIVLRLPLQNVFVSASQSIRSHADVEGILVIPTFAELLSSLCCPVVAENFETG